MGTAKKSVLVIEDHPKMRRLISRAIASQSDFELLAAGTAEEALELAGERHLDLFLVDISLPGMSGLELVRRLGKRGANHRCLVLSGHAEPEYVRAAQCAGARGFVPKGEPEHLLDAIGAVLSDGQYWPTRD